MRANPIHYWSSRSWGMGCFSSKINGLVLIKSKKAIAMGFQYVWMLVDAMSELRTRCYLYIHSGYKF